MEDTPYDAAMSRSKQELARQVVDCNARIAALEADNQRLQSCIDEREEALRTLANPWQNQLGRIAALEKALEVAAVRFRELRYEGFAADARAAAGQSSPPKESERDIDAESLDASGSWWPNGRRPPDAVG